MNKRALLKLLAFNNTKSPDILTATTIAKTHYDAVMLQSIYLDITGKDLSFSPEEWRKSVNPPVELYFAFDHKKDYLKFLRQVKHELPEQIIF